jgi:SWI/SNF related-matrix-associated actin-dependent regulator of chromatin subfamily C
MQQFSEMEALLQAERREVERMRQRLFLDRLAFRRRVHEAESKMAGLKIEVPATEKMGVERGEGEIEPLAEDSEGFMRHEI